ncbi:MAG: hypothetical protein ABL985_13225 [Casimicrobium sp.]
MKYLVRKLVLAPVPEYEISAQDFAKVRRAQFVLANSLAIEEKYEILISNFIDFERTTVSLALTDSIRDIATHTEMFENRVALNTRLANVLSAARLYLDQLPQHMADGLANELADQKKQLKDKCSQEYDQHFEYRFMEALRNHAQHRGTPVHRTTYLSAWKSADSDRFMEFSIRAIATREKLSEDETFKKTVLKEMPNEVDLASALRRYLESISNIHSWARSVLQDKAGEARTFIESLRTRYSQMYRENLAGLAAIQVEDNGLRSVSGRWDLIGMMYESPYRIATRN